MTGSFGDMACYSFYANKIITTGEGGMVVTNSADLAARMAMLRDHGMAPGRRYWHLAAGYNYRMTNLQAAVGLAQLERIDVFLGRRADLVKRYNAYLTGQTGQSIGKKIAGVKIVSEQTGMPIGGGMGIVRHFAHSLDSIFCGLPIGYLWPLWDAKKQVTITNEVVQHVIDYTPYEGMQVTGWPVATIRRGEVTMRDGKVLAAPTTWHILADLVFIGLAGGLQRVTQIRRDFLGALHEQAALRQRLLLAVVELVHDDRCAGRRRAHAKGVRADAALFAPWRRDPAQMGGDFFADIGSHLVDALVGRGYTVTVLDNLEPQVHRSGR